MGQQCEHFILIEIGQETEKQMKQNKQQQQ